MKATFSPRRLLLAAAVSSALPAFATPRIDEEVVVTATRTPVAAAQSLSRVELIDREEIRAAEPMDFVDLLRRTPGVDFARNGGPGSNASLYLRGTGSGHTLFLVDGLRLGSATLGSTSFQFLNPDQIERVEVVKGPLSALYGSDALGGVVQLFTRDGTGTLGHYLSAATGSHDLAKVAAGTSGRRDGWHWGLHGSFLDSRGIDNQVNDAGRNADNDGYRNRAVNAAVGHRFAQGAHVAARVWHSDNRNEYDDAFDADAEPYGDTELSAASLEGRLPVGERLTSRLLLGVVEDDSTNRERISGTRTGTFRTERRQLAWQNDLRLAAGHLLTLGLDWWEDEVDSTTRYATPEGRVVDARDTEAVYAQYQGEVGPFSLVAGLRRDDHQGVGDRTTGRIALGVDLDARHRLTAGYAEGFKAPSFNDLYWPAGPFSAGNPNLRPETSQAVEVGLEGDYEIFGWTADAFQIEIDDLIQWAAGPDFVWRPYNVAEARIRGVELGGWAELHGWHLAASYTHQEPEDRETGNRLPNRAEKTLLLSAQRAIADWTFSTYLRAQGNRYSNAANTRKVGNHAIVGVGLARRFGEWEVRLRVDNLLDQEYRLIEGYRQEGRVWQLGLTWDL
ncbi:MAG: TonB-dependent receptor [Porticoccaceae bacterium]|nr:MAG: TonB-dependent receptor [Porticoccaceae bacterium]